jgi:Flp pilus assembly protein TadD
VQAAGQLEKAVEAGLNDATVFNYLGICYSRTGRLPQAVASYQKARKNDNSLEQAHLNLGFAYERLKRTAQAKTQYHEACRLKMEFCRITGRDPQ